MSEYYFRTSDLSVGYSGRVLIHDIEIRLKKGEILTLIGPNGSGKSTILKSITKHLAAIRGDSFIADASVAAMSYKEMSKQLAVVLTERIKGELLTCYDVVATGRYPYPAPWASCPRRTGKRSSPLWRGYTPGSLRTRILPP